MREELSVRDWGRVCRSSLDDLIGVTCPVCGEGIKAWYGWWTRAMNANCEKLCSYIRIDGLSAPPPWAEPGANTTIHTEFGARTFELIAPETTLEDIDAERGVMKAQLRPNGWAKCPHCGKSFTTYAHTSWDGRRHVSCRTRLELIKPNKTSGGKQGDESTHG